MSTGEPITDEQPHTRIRLPHDPYASPTQPPKTRWGSGLSALGVIALVITAVAVTNRTSAPAPPPGSAASPRPASGATLGTGAVVGVPVGYPHTEVGAESAATNYAVAYGSEAMFRRETRRQIVRTVADPAVEPVLQAQLDSSFQALQKNFGLDSDGDPPPGSKFVYRTLPAGTHLASYSGDTAAVEVWTNGIVGLAGRTSAKPVVEAWSTVTVNLRWVGEDWKWVSFSQSDGPTPVSGAQPVSDSDAIAEAARKFGGYRYVR
jgi:hypothetical protein